MPAVACLLAALPLCGCSTRHDPGYNAYAPPRGRATVLQTTDRAADFPLEALDNLDARIENMVY